MKVKQQTLKGFECDIDDVESFKAYYTKNEPLMQGHLLMLKGIVDDELKLFLEMKKVAFIDANKSPLSTRKKRSTAILEEVLEKKPEPKKEVPESDGISMVFDRTIRSGEAIHVDEDLVFFGRINSGAVIETSCSVQVFGIMDGLIKSDGEYILLKKIGLGTVIFHGEEIDKSIFDGNLKLIKYDNGLVIKDL